MVAQVGFEPTTHGLEVRCSIQLSYWAMVGLTGFEPATLCSQSRCATKLRYNPMELMIGFEPTTRCLQNSCAAIAPHQHWYARQDSNLQPRDYESPAPPLSYRRVSLDAQEILADNPSIEENSQSGRYFNGRMVHAKRSRIKYTFIF